MEAKHTPGPWEVGTLSSKPAGGELVGIIRRSPVWEVAQVAPPMHTQKVIAYATSAADAVLLAAAPDLLAACEDVLNRLDLESAVDAMDNRDCDHPRAAIRDLLRAAIAKATA